MKDTGEFWIWATVTFTIGVIWWLILQMPEFWKTVIHDFLWSLG